ncbi:MAG: response regulator transcription factor [Pseudorhodoplanes sp.]|nr:response regulator transcription factor [Pseudorhodoplanes sp.]
MTSSRTPIERDTPPICIIDDDEELCLSLLNLFRSVGLKANYWTSTQAFLKADASCDPKCLILDVRLPDSSGLDFQDELERMGRDIPIIFITGHGDIPMTVRAMKAGAVEFLTKPVREEDLLSAVRAALARSKATEHEAERFASVRSHYASLTSREREVLKYVAAGMMNKQIASRLGLSEITVKVHRRNMMTKMKASSLADLVRMADSVLAAPDNGPSSGVES